MLDLEIASYLFPAVRNGAIIILCGDDNQLESVGYGKVLADLIDGGKVEVYRLYQIMRQSGTICENASIILSGSAEIKLDESFSLHRYTSDNEAVKAMMSNLKYECSFVLSPVKKKGEAAKVAIRNIRRDANDMLKKLGKTDVSEDEIAELEDSVQKMTDKFIKKVDEAVEVKSKEILTV